MEKCRLPLWCATRIRNQQWEAVRLRLILKMVCRAPHQKLLFISWTSSGKWASGSYQQDHFQNFEKEVG
jgi:hypothetical protein